MPPRHLIRIGSRFGAWKTVGREFRSPCGERKVLCRCDCGREQEVRTHRLRHGVSTKGCFSCRRKEHGGRNTIEYRCWLAMNNRCRNPASQAYAHYGGRGICVCAQWCGPGGFPRFLKDVGARPSLAHSIDRIDNDGHYAPGNVRWATSGEQRRNRPDVNRILHKGAFVLAIDLAKKHGLNAGTVRSRIVRGEEPLAAATRPAIPRARLTRADAEEIRARAGRGHRHGDIARDFGVHPSHISKIVHGRTWRDPGGSNDATAF